MAAVTAAVIGTVATVAATGYSVAQQASASGGGGSTQQPKFGQVPGNPQDKAMRDYYARTLVQNADKTYPAFSDYLSSGGDPTKAKFDLEMPNLSPSEASALGFTGPKGEQIPGVKQSDISAEGIATMTPEQRLYLAKERARRSRAIGSEPGPWSGNVETTDTSLRNAQKRLSEVQASTTMPLPRQERKIGRLTDRVTRLTEQQKKQLGG